jgi:hypothetical protein
MAPKMDGFGRVLPRIWGGLDGLWLALGVMAAIPSGKLPTAAPIGVSCRPGVVMPLDF